MNLPNIISLSRIPSIFLIVALLFFPFKGSAVLVFVLYFLAAMTDVLDGYIARKYGIISKFGILMDALIDKIFVIGFFVIIIAFQLLPQWGLLCVLLIIGREFLISGLRQVLAASGKVLAAERAGKFKAFMQFFCIGAYLFENMARTDFLSWMPGWFLTFNVFIAHFSLVAATLLTIQSAYYYLSKNWKLFISDAHV